MIEKKSITKYLNEEYSQSALYDCYRMIGSYIDGLKPSSRKVVYTIRKKNLNSEEKVSRLASTVAGETEYLHGEANLQGVIVNLAQDFIGSNNIPLLQPIGNFGSRHVPIASASRYIFTKKAEKLENLFSKLDDDILIEQEFEGSTIEPKFFVPLIPLILINGSEGIGTGFAQKILPRKEIDIVEAIRDILTSGDTKKRLKPSYNGFAGKIQQGLSDYSWEIMGDFNIKDTTTINITEIPIGYSLSNYLKVLNRLVDSKEIKSFEDLSENDKFLFVIKTTREFTKLSRDEILNKLKLIKRVSENFTCINENNEVQVFNSPKELLNSFIEIRLEYYEKRRKNIIDKLEKELVFLNSIIVFIEAVISGKIIINNKPKKEIEKQIELIKDIKPENNSYDFLLKLPIYNLTKEKIIELKNKIKEKRNNLNYYTKATPKNLWQVDLEDSFGTK